MGWRQQAAAECASNGADTDDICFTCHQMSSFQHWPNPLCPRAYGFGGDTGGGGRSFWEKSHLLNSQANIPLASDCTSTSRKVPFELSTNVSKFLATQ